MKEKLPHESEIYSPLSLYPRMPGQLGDHPLMSLTASAGTTGMSLLSSSPGLMPQEQRMNDNDHLPGAVERFAFKALMHQANALLIVSGLSFFLAFNRHLPEGPNKRKRSCFYASSLR